MSYPLKSIVTAVVRGYSTYVVISYPFKVENVGKKKERIKSEFIATNRPRKNNFHPLKSAFCL
jgi:hypothetical protein